MDEAVRNIDLIAARGKHIREAWVGLGGPHRCNIPVPDVLGIMTFDVKLSDKDVWLVLDPEGDDRIPYGMREELIGPVSKEFGYTVAVHRSCGMIAIARFSEFVRKAGGLRLGLRPLEGLVCSSSGLARLDELRDEKRPFTMTVRDDALLAFADRQVGYRDLRKAIVLALRFRGTWEEIGKGMRRQVTNWELR